MIQPRRQATTIGELDTSLGFVMEELHKIRSTQERMETLLATKAEVSEHVRELNKKIEEHSPRRFWRGLTEIAVGITALSAAIGVMVAVVRFIKP